jgi:hypothetical protein
VTVVPEEPVTVVPEEPVTVVPELVQQVSIPALNLNFEHEDTLDDQSPPLSPVVDIDTVVKAKQVEHEPQQEVQDTVCTGIESPVISVSGTTSSVNEPPSFDDIEFYDDPTTHKTYYLDSKTKRVFEIAPNDEIGVFVKQL